MWYSHTTCVPTVSVSVTAELLVSGLPLSPQTLMTDGATTEGRDVCFISIACSGDGNEEAKLAYGKVRQTSLLVDQLCCVDDGNAAPSPPAFLHWRSNRVTKAPCGWAGEVSTPRTLTNSLRLQDFSSNAGLSARLLFLAPQLLMCEAQGRDVFIHWDRRSVRPSPRSSCHFFDMVPKPRECCDVKTRFSCKPQA